MSEKSRSNNNTGLGLSITKAFVENLGHRIRTYKEYDKISIEILWKKNQRQQ